jgi:hypothetical protein
MLMQGKLLGRLSERETKKAEKEKGSILPL